MKTLYHIDKKGSLSSGMTIDLTPKTPSSFGQQFYKHFEKFGITENLKNGNHPSALQIALLNDPAYREFYLELIRLHHPQVKILQTVSRLSSFFAVRSVEDAQRCIKRLKLNGNPKIYAIEYDIEPIFLDMTWLDFTFPRDINKFGYYYANYWQGSILDQDPSMEKNEGHTSLLEALITSKVTIGNSIDY